MSVHESRITLMSLWGFVGSMANPNLNRDYHDPEVLEEMYHNEGLTQEQIAAEFNVSQRSISRSMKRLDVETRSHTEHFATHQREHAGFHTDSGGYERSYSQKEKASIHRLCAVAWFGLESVVGNHIHHKSNIPWDNRESNIEPVSPGDHNRIHKSE